MSQLEDLAERDSVRAIIVRYAANFPASEITELASRLLHSERTRNAWERILGDVVACAVYNGVDLAKAEQLAVRPPDSVEPP